MSIRVRLRSLMLLVASVAVLLAVFMTHLRRASVCLVTGDIARPGPIVTFLSKRTIADALAASGGVTRRATGGTIRLVRKGPSGLDQVFSYDPARPDTNRVLEAGDRVVVYGDPIRSAQFGPPLPGESK